MTLNAFFFNFEKNLYCRNFFWMIYRLLFHRLRVVSLFFRFSKGSARARGRWAAKPRETRAAARLAPSVTRVVICVSRAFCSTDQEKRETARGLLRTDNGDFLESVAEKQTSHHFKLFRDYPNRTIARGRYLTTTTRIHFGFALLFNFVNPAED